MNKKAMNADEITINITLEREIEGFTAEYDVEASCDYMPEEGDDWNSPHIAETVSFACAAVRAVRVFDNTGEHVDPERYTGDLTPVGEAIELSAEELKRVITAAWNAIEEREDLEASLKCEAYEERLEYMRELKREGRLE